VTDADPADGLRLSSAYDEKRWIAIPDPRLVDVDRWSRDVSHAWAQDLGRLNDHNWADILRRILLVTIERAYEGDPDRIFVHLLTPARQAPSPAATFVAVRPMASPLDDVAVELAASDPDLVEPTTAVPAVLKSGEPAYVITSHRRDGEGAITTALRVIWEIEPGALALVTASGTNPGRILIMRDDMVELAGGLAIIPDDPQ
jgi:hypothetical protein